MYPTCTGLISTSTQTLINILFAAFTSESQFTGACELVIAFNSAFSIVLAVVEWTDECSTTLVHAVTVELIENSASSTRKCVVDVDIRAKYIVVGIPWIRILKNQASA